MIRSSRLILPILLLATQFLACSSQPPEEGYSFRISQENGVTVAKTTNGPKYSSPIFTVEEVARIQEDESIVQSLLTRPLWMGIDEGGMIYVLDGFGSFEEVRLLVFHRDGTYSHQIGRYGSGPGDYSNPQFLTISNDILTLYEYRHRRISWFSTDGPFIDLFTCAPGNALPERAILTEEGNQILIDFTFADSRKWYKREAVIRTSDGDKLGEVETNRIPAHKNFRSTMGRHSTPPHFSGSPIIDYSPLHGILKTNGNDPVLEWFDQNGDLSKIFDLGLIPSPVSDEDRALVDSYYATRNTEGDRLYDRFLRELQQKKDRYPPMRSFWNAVTIDEYGYLWLEDPSCHFHLSERHYRVVSPEGEYLGDCFLPQGHCYLPQGIAGISHGHYLRINTDRDLGIQELIVYRLVSAVDGFDYPN